MSIQLQFGEAELIVCGRLERCGQYQLEDGTKGHAGAVLMLGRTVKFTATEELSDTLKPHVGRTVFIAGDVKVGDNQAKIGRVTRVYDQNQNQLFAIGGHQAVPVGQPVAAAAGPRRMAA